MKKILLAGSSIFEQWFNAADVVPEHRLINRAIGGTVTTYWIEHLSAILAEEDPDVLWFYCGSNDLCGETIPYDIADNIITCRRIASARNPALRFAYFSIIKAPQKEGRWDIIDSIHNDIRQQLEPADLFVDLNEIFFPAEQPMRGLFIEDGLHLTCAAYNAMVNLSRPMMHAWLND